MMEQITERFSKYLFKNCSFKGVVFLYYTVIIIVFLATLLFYFLYLLAIPQSLKLLFISLIVYTLLIFVVWLRLFFSGAYFVLREELDPVRAIQILKLRKLLPTKGLPTLTLVEMSYCYFIIGDDDMLHTYLKEAEARWYFRFIPTSYKLFHRYLSLRLQQLQGKTIQIEDYQRAIDAYSVKNKRLQTINQKRLNVLQAVSDLEKGISNDYFDTSDNPTLLDRLIATYYTARNECIKGNTAKAKELLTTIIPYSDTLLIVRQAKQLLEEID